MQGLTLEAQELLSSVDISADGTKILSSGHDKNLINLADRPNRSTRVWDVSSGRMLQEIIVSSNTDPYAIFNPVSQDIAVIQARNGVEIRDSSSGERKLAIRFLATNPKLAYSPDGQQLLIAGTYSGASLFDSSTGELLRNLKESRTFGDKSYVFSPDGAAIVDSIHGMVWKTETGELRLKLKPETPGMFGTGVTYHPNGSRIAMSRRSPDGVFLFEARTGVQTLMLNVILAPPRSVRFSPNGRFLVAGNGGNQIVIWDAGPPLP